MICIHKEYSTPIIFQLTMQIFQLLKNLVNFRLDIKSDKKEHLRIVLLKSIAMR